MKVQESPSVTPDRSAGSQKGSELNQLKLKLQAIETQLGDAMRRNDVDCATSLIFEIQSLKSKIYTCEQILAQSPYKPKIEADVLVAGNPGAGKSTLLNSMATILLFKSGLSLASGLTRNLHIREYEGQKYIDTPGFADRTVRKAAGEEISVRLRAGGKIKIFFVIQQNSGRVINEDQVTVQIVLEAAPEIGGKYGVIVNQVPQAVISDEENGFATDAGRARFAKQFQSNIPPKLRTEHFFFCRLNPNLNGRNNVLTPLPKNLRKFLDLVPIAVLNPNPTITINTDMYEDLVTKTKQLEAKTKQLESAKRAAEAAAVKEAEARRVANQKAAEERAAKLAAESGRRDAERKAEANRIAKEKSDKEVQAKTKQLESAKRAAEAAAVKEAEARRVANQKITQACAAKTTAEAGRREAERKAEANRIAKEKSDKEKRVLEAKCLHAEQQREKLVKTEASRLEKERLAMEKQIGETVPVYQYYRAKLQIFFGGQNPGNHLYTTNAAEIGTITPGHTGNHGYQYQGIAFYVYAHPGPGRQPLYRFCTKTTKPFFGTLQVVVRVSYLYTTNKAEAQNMTSCTDEGVMGYVPLSGHGKAHPVYRFVKGSNNFYTQNKEVYGTTLPGQVGLWQGPSTSYVFQGVAFYSAPKM